ncbi:MAG: hypothetical protein KAW42_07305 [Candidatus Atribacteria bacterium]|nr:hypothetical protein [Candidatus Atribacteria bacterium]
MINIISIKKLIAKVSQLYLIANFLISSFRCLASNSFFQVAFPIEKLLISSLSCPIFLINWTKMVIVAVYVIVLLVVRPIKWVNYMFVFLIILGLFTGLFYSVKLDSRTITIDGQTYTKGDQLLEYAKDYLKENPSVTEEEYFLWIGKKQSEVWTSESLEKNKLILGGLYLLVVGIIGFGILGGLEIIARSNSAWLQSVSGKMAKNQKTSGKQYNL